MIRYINPLDESKEDFLSRVGVEVLLNNIKEKDIPNGHMLVILTTNEHFSTATVIDNEHDRKRLLDPADARLKKIFFVAKDLLNNQTPDAVEAIRRLENKGELVPR